MDQLKILVHGALGKMGQEVVKAACSDPGLEAVAGVDIRAKDKQLLSVDNSCSVPLTADLESALSYYHPDVMVDFTVAQVAMRAVRIAIKYNVRMVIGTTGLSTDELVEIRDLCRSHEIGAVVAPNFSLAAVMMIHLAKKAAPYFDYAEIIEMHHEQKVDAPSGTALATAREMIAARGKAFTYVPASDERIAGSRGGEFEGVGLHSVRMPGMLAHQEIILGASGQTLKIRLDQIDREAFMPGVILAIKKVVEMKEMVLGLDRLLGL